MDPILSHRDLCIVIALPEVVHDLSELLFENDPVAVTHFALDVVNSREVVFPEVVAEFFHFGSRDTVAVDGRIYVRTFPSTVWTDFVLAICHYASGFHKRVWTEAYRSLLPRVHFHRCCYLWERLR